MFSDASGSFGCGALSETQGFYQLKWPPNWEASDITVKELLPIVISAGIWGRAWQQKHVRFHCDNMAVVEILRSSTGRGPKVANLLQCLFFYSAYYSFQFSVVHVPGLSNTAADALSRNNLMLFASLFPQVKPCTIPQSLKDLLVTAMPDWGSTSWTNMFRLSLKVVLPLHNLSLSIRTESPSELLYSFSVILSSRK